MSTLWIRLIKYTAVGTGSLFVFFLLVIGAAGVQAALSDHKETNVSDQVAGIQDKQLGHQVMSIVETLYEDAQKNITLEESTLDRDDAQNLVISSELEEQITKLQQTYTGSDEAELLSLLKEWHQMSYEKENWVEVKSNTWVFMKEAAERHDVFWDKISDVPDDLHYKLEENKTA
ncbi:MAG: hypothetical protein WD907_03490 [Bacilli bacterium]